jgi:hypothetical protein
MATFISPPLQVMYLRSLVSHEEHALEALERLGRERAMIYKTMVLTGLRKGELASLTIGALELADDRRAFAALAARPTRRPERGPGFP